MPESLPNSPRSEVEKYNATPNANITASLEKFVNNKISPQNIDRDFNIGFFIDYTQSEASTNKAYNNFFLQLSSVLSTARDNLNKYDQQNLFSEYNRATVQGRINAMTTPPNNMPKYAARDMLLAWDYFDYFRELTKRIVHIQDAHTQKRKELREGDVSFGSSLKEGLSTKLSEMSKNWSELPIERKLLVVGGVIAAGVIFLKSDDPTVKSIKEGMWTALKIGGISYLAFEGYRIFTGESPWQTLTNSNKPSAKDSEFFKKHFALNDKQHESFLKTIAFIGDNNFMDLSYQYQKSEKSKKIEGLQVDPSDAYVGLEVFFNKYNINKVRDRVRNENPPLTLSQVITITMAEDPSAQIHDSLGTRWSRYASDITSQNYNSLATTSQGIYLRSAYSRYFGKEATKKQIDAIKDNFRGEVGLYADIGQAIHESIVREDNQVALNYKSVFNNGAFTEPTYNLRYINGADGFTYVVSEVNAAQHLNSERHLRLELEKGKQNAETFLSLKHSKSNNEIRQSALSSGYLFCAENGKAYYFARHKA